MITPSLLRKVLLLVIGLLFIVPTLLGACLGTVVAGAKLYELFFINGPTPTAGIFMHVKLVAMTLMGWAGLITLAMLLYHFLKSHAAPAWHQKAWTGLLCGGAACISLVAWFDTSLSSRVMVFGWPLIAVFIFAGLLASAQRRDMAGLV